MAQVGSVIVVSFAAVGQCQCSNSGAGHQRACRGNRLLCHQRRTAQCSACSHRLRALHHIMCSGAVSPPSTALPWPGWKVGLLYAYWLPRMGAEPAAAAARDCTVKMGVGWGEAQISFSHSGGGFKAANPEGPAPPPHSPGAAHLPHHTPPPPCRSPCGAGGPARSAG